MATADAETYTSTNTAVTYERLRDDLQHEANRLKDEIVVLATMLEKERQLRRRRESYAWFDDYLEQLAAYLGHQNYTNTHLGEYLRRH